MSTTTILIAAGVAGWLLAFTLVWLFVAAGAKEDRRIAASRDRATAATVPDDRDRPTRAADG